MEEAYEQYLELYPIQQALYQEINSLISVHGTVGDGNVVFVDSTFGTILYDSDYLCAKVKYPLNSSKNKESIKPKLMELYGHYQGVEIIEENRTDTVFDKFLKPCDLIVQIPCEENRMTYLKMDVIKQQEFRIAAYENIKSGAIVFTDDSAITNRKR